MRKFFFRLIINLLKFACVSVPLQLLGIIALATYIPFTSPAGNDKSLPYFLRWFDCADFYANRDTSTYLKVIAEGKFARWYWLAIRNPINYFNYMYLGFYMDSKATTDFSMSTNTRPIGDSSDCNPGLWITEISCKDGNYYEYYYIYKWTSNYCFRFRMGWKIGQKGLTPGYVQDVFVISPFKSYNGN